MLISLLPLRDRRERIVGYTLTGYPDDIRRQGTPDAEARELLDAVPAMRRMAGRSLLVPVTPTLVRDGALARLTGQDAVWLLATEALADEGTRRAVDRLVGTGAQFALHGAPEAPLPMPSLAGSVVVLDAARTPPAILEHQVRQLLEAGMVPLARAVNDRVTRQRVLRIGVPLYMGRQLPRGAGTAPDRTLEDSLMRAITLLATFADGRPPDSDFFQFLRDDLHVGAALLTSVNQVPLGVRTARTVAQAISLLGRDALIDQVTTAVARLIGDVARDPELGIAALRRARLCERVAVALDTAPHPRARIVAGLLSTLEYALGAPAVEIAQRLTLPPALRDVLDERATPLGQLLDVVDAMEFGWWEDMSARSSRLGIRPRVVSDAWREAWRIAREDFGTTRTDAP